jgi:hypothetical protein
VAAFEGNLSAPELKCPLPNEPVYDSEPSLEEAIVAAGTAFAGLRIPWYDLPPYLPLPGVGTSGARKRKVARELSVIPLGPGGNGCSVPDFAEDTTSRRELLRIACSTVPIPMRSYFGGIAPARHRESDHEHV